MKKLLSWLVLVCVLFTLPLPALAEAADARAIESKALDFYFCDPDTAAPFDVWFIDGSDVPYMALSDWPTLLDKLAQAAPEATFAPIPAFSMAGGVGTLTRPDGYSVDFDCDADTIHFLDYDAYMHTEGDAFIIDLLDGKNTVEADGTIRYFARVGNSYERYGREVTVSAADYGIDFIARGGECYVPMQTLSDILLSYGYFNIYYNGECAVVATLRAFGSHDKGPTPLGELYFSVKPHDRSETMARFAYNELCMTMDALYGLKDNHGITTFAELFEDTGLVEGLAGTDAVEADAALYQLLWVYLDDQHAKTLTASPGSGFDADAHFVDLYGEGQSRSAFDALESVYKDARDAAFPGGVPHYQEIGNTAWITFDEFEVIPEGVDYYQAPLAAQTEADVNQLDTMSLMIYAYQQITREGSPIENVVMDLSCNLGGESQAAIYAIASFLGVCPISARDTFTGALVTGNYTIDLNLDGASDEADRLLTKKNLFCLESPVSFSCGNLVPCAFKSSNKVTLLGRASGGGACVVLPLSTADGSAFRISGPLQLSFLKNGAFYDIDRGAEPDFPLMKPESFYDRPALVDYINAIR